MYKKTVGEKVFDGFNCFFLLFISLITIYPFWECFAVSLMPLSEYLKSPIHIIPRSITLDMYKAVMDIKEFWVSYGNTLFVTIVGTSVNLLLTVMAAYPLCKKDLPAQRIIMFLIIFTMIFSGGIIPLYIIVRSLHLMNTQWALILPTAISTYNLIVLRNFYSALPEELEEAATIDGCNEIETLFRIIVPVSKPAIVTITVFYAVANWNQFFSAVFYITDRKEWPIQMFLRAILFDSDNQLQTGGEKLFMLGKPFKMAAVMAAVLPIVCLYPVLQRYFEKGVMVGAVKG